MLRASFRVVLALFLTAALLAGCGKKHEQRIQFYAAASLTDAVQELAEAWAEKDSGELVPVLASSSTLARQIKAGAPAALFLSASEQWMDYLVRESERVRSASRIDLLGNSLVLVVPPGNPARVVEPADLGEGRVESIAVGDPSHVPAGIYAVAWLNAAGLQEKVAKKLRPASDVRAALAWVERGEVDAGIVYFTDARVGNVEVAALLDPGLIPPIRYPLALLAGKKGQAPSEAAQAFYRWLLSEEAAEIFRRNSFVTLTGRP